MKDVEFYEFVLSASEGADALVCTGELTANWILEYQNFLNDIRTEWLHEVTWPRKAFLAMHNASIHLPLRYDVWSRSKNRRNFATESVLVSIRFETELFLWSCLCDPSKWPTANKTGIARLEKNDCDLIALCFGEQSPLGPIDETTSFNAWKRRYESALQIARNKWNNESHWPQVLSVAIHFASVYVDLFQIRDVQLGLSYATDSQQLHKVEVVINGLRNCIDNDYVLALIRVWLEASGVGRDNSGLPEIGAVRKRTGQFVSVRTMSELFLQESVRCNN